MGSTTEGSAFEVTANPWDLSTVPGGSAAAVSARQCVVSLGSDTGESVKLSKCLLAFVNCDMGSPIVAHVLMLFDKMPQRSDTFVLDGTSLYAFGENGRPASGDESAVPPNASLQIDLELISWKAVSDITKDKKVLKKTLKEGEGYERPNDGAVVQALIRHILSIDIDPESLEIASLNAEELKQQQSELKACFLVQFAAPSLLSFLEFCS
ncbi:hypothetical protein Ahy_A01g004823 [Arachis hypogaea]|uniref:peptidylprolyl isomerase n=1 Tax=Arachis hypogaea TaxID=3818 RepID=A0A445EX87_ARAHY|nr:hypothetical protein Ahy_A01g004823 [Arachis hypogaea]